MRPLIIRRYKYPVSLAIILLMHCIYLAGVLTSHDSRLIEFIPLIMLASFIIVLLNHSRWNRFFFAFILSVLISGLFVEVVGVATGWIFGKYSYGSALGFKYFDVPLIMGIHWFITVYCSGMTSNVLRSHWIFRALFASALMVLYDISLERVAIALDLWTWDGGITPLRHYISWFIIAFLMQSVFQSLEIRLVNRLAIALFVVQWAFFLALSFLLG